MANSISSCAYVIFVETKSSVYGGQKQLLARCKEFDLRGIQYAVIHPFSESVFSAEYRALGLNGRLITPPTIPFNIGSALGLGKKIAQSGFILSKLIELARRGDRDVVIHCDAFDSAYLVSMADSIPGMLSGDALKVFSVNSDRYRFFSRLDRSLLPRFDRILTNSEFSRTQLLQYEWLARYDISVCYSAIDFDSLDAIAETAGSQGAVDSDWRRVGYVGSFDRRKQLDQFVRCAVVALRRCKNYPQLDFVIFGDAKNAEQEAFAGEVRRRIVESGYEDRIRFAGYRSAAEIVSQTDALLCPFKHEPFGRVVPEFLYLGLEVFVIKDGGLAEAGCGYARELGAVDGPALEDSFLEALGEWCVAAPLTESSLEKRRKTLREKFGSAAIVDCELLAYRAS